MDLLKLYLRELSTSTAGRRKNDLILPSSRTPEHIGAHSYRDCDDSDELFAATATTTSKNGTLYEPRNNSLHPGHLPPDAPIAPSKCPIPPVHANNAPTSSGRGFLPGSPPNFASDL
jgi:hypothetical protein